jgi:hypothetical protein
MHGPVKNNPVRQNFEIKYLTISVYPKHTTSQCLQSKTSLKIPRTLSINGIENPNGLSRNNGTTGHTQYNTIRRQTKQKARKMSSTKAKPGEKLTKYCFISLTWY